MLGRGGAIASEYFQNPSPIPPNLWPEALFVLGGDLESGLDRSTVESRWSPKWSEETVLQIGNAAPPSALSLLAVIELDLALAYTAAIDKTGEVPVLLPHSQL